MTTTPTCDCEQYEFCSACTPPEPTYNKARAMAAIPPTERKLTLEEVLDELNQAARDFGYPVDWACSIIEARLRGRFERVREDNVLEFQVREAGR